MVGVYGGEMNYDWTGWLNTNMDAVTQSKPTNFTRSGAYYYGSGGISTRSDYGYYWNLRANSTTYTNYLVFNSTILNLQANYKGSGYSLRCLGC